MKRYLLFVLTAFLLEALLLALLQDRPALAPYMPQQDKALTYAFGLAWPLGLLLLFLRRTKPAKPKKQSSKPPAKKSASSQSRKKKSGSSRAAKSS
ncbi:MAG: hypothetical protein ACXVC1_02060 [Tumebacillaceae bacterium]